VSSGAAMRSKPVALFGKSAGPIAVVAIAVVSAGPPLYLWLAPTSGSKWLHVLGVCLGVAGLIVSLAMGVLIWRDARLLGPLSTYFFSLVIVASVVLGFSILHWLAGSDPVNGRYTMALDKTKAVYFTMTVFSTTGFGDIAAKKNLSMWLVTVQMFLGFALIAGTLTVAISRAMERKTRPN
jgi:voltage-gated potassium channel